MTAFEELAIEIIGKVEIGKDGFYTKHTRALATIINDIILSDETFNLTWDEQKELIKEKFYKMFPYMKK